MKHSKVLTLVVLAGFLCMSLFSLVNAAANLKDLTYPAKTKGEVVFKHGAHVNDYKLKCKDCHPAVFKMKQGTSGMTMETINKGEHCAKCHDGVQAFEGKTSFDAKAEANCGKCHTTPSTPPAETPNP